jgi:negative regulator of flagellin synthesis FlgM
MRIDAYNQIQQVYGSTKAGKYDDKKNMSTSFADQLQLSQSAQDATVVKKALADVPDIRQDLVSSLKERINNGTYDVDIDDFASKLLDNYNNGLF